MRDLRTRRHPLDASDWDGYGRTSNEEEALREAFRQKMTQARDDRALATVTWGLLLLTAGILLGRLVF